MFVENKELKKVTEEVGILKAEKKGERRNREEMRRKEKINQ